MRVNPNLQREYLEPEHIIDEQASIKGVFIEDVYDNCVKWLKKYSAELLEENDPFFIKAYHKGQRAWYEDWGKVISISLKKEAGFVNIRVIMDEREENPFLEGYENRRRSWSKLVEDLWKHLGVEMNNEMLEDLYSKSDLEKIIGDHKNRALMLGCVFIFVLLVVLWYPPRATMAIIVFVFLIIGIIGEVRNITMYQRILRDLYPDR
jgi:hypothetical protein